MSKVLDSQEEFTYNPVKEESTPEADLQNELDKYNQALPEALTPFYTFIEMVMAESGNRNIYRYIPGATLEERMVPWKTARNLGSFYVNNPHLKPLKDLPPIWQLYQEKIDEPFYRFLCPGHIGAFLLAAEDIGYKLKYLIESPDVRGKFAVYAAKKYVSPKSNAYASGVNGQGQVQYRVSSGYNTTRIQDVRWLLGCKMWFKDARLTRRPYQVDHLILETELMLKERFIEEQKKSSKFQVLTDAEIVKMKPEELLEQIDKEGSEELKVYAGFLKGYLDVKSGEGYHEVIRK
jgi:hypothetical protein